MVLVVLGSQTGEGRIKAVRCGYCVTVATTVMHQQTDRWVSKWTKIVYVYKHYILMTRQHKHTLLFNPQHIHTSWTKLQFKTKIIHIFIDSQSCIWMRNHIHQLLSHRRYLFVYLWQFHYKFTILKVLTMIWKLYSLLLIYILLIYYAAKLGINIVCIQDNKYRDDKWKYVNLLNKRGRGVSLSKRPSTKPARYQQQQDMR